MLGLGGLCAYRAVSAAIHAHGFDRCKRPRAGKPVEALPVWSGRLWARTVDRRLYVPGTCFRRALSAGHK